MTFARTLFTVLASAAAVLVGNNAVAQPMGKTLVVPFGVAEQPVSPEASQVEAALQRQHVTVLSLHEAHDRFLARSRTAQKPAPSDIDALAKEAHAAIEHVALGRTGAAQHSVQHIIALAEHSLETLNRETATARGLLDACLALVRASLHENKRDEALEQAMRCRRLVPDLAPSDVAHPANVVGALAEADDQLRRMRVGSLSVNAAPERGCEVFLNGRHLGHTPFSLERAPAGPYRVQVECAGETAGRVHVVELGDDPAKLTVDAGFDAAIATEPRLSLRYRNEDAARGSLVHHAALLGADARAQDVVLVGRIAGSPVVLRVQTQEERLIAGARLGDASSAGPRRAAEGIIHGRFEGVDASAFRPLPPEPLSPTKPAQPTPASEIGPRIVPASDTDKPRPVATTGSDTSSSASAAPETRSVGVVATGGVLAGLGIAGLATGFGLYAHALKLRDRTDDDTPGSAPQQRAQSKYDDFRLKPLAGLAGAALLTAAVPMLMPKHAPRSVAAWVGGGLAGAAGLAAIVFGAVRTPKDPSLGGLLMGAGVPLITIPITQLVRAARE